MKKISLILCISLICLSVSAQHKSLKKIPKVLKTTWYLLDKTTDYDAVRVEIKESVLTISSPYSFEKEQEQSTNDYTKKEEAVKPSSDTTAYTEEISENDFQMLEYVKQTPESGYIILKQKINNLYAFLKFQKLSDSKVELNIKTYLDDEAQARKMATENQGIFWEGTHLKIYEKYQQMPAMPELSEADYANWWDDFLKVVNQPDIKKQLATQNVYLGIGLDTYNEHIKKICRNIFLTKGYNPFNSMDALQTALNQYAFPETIREKIRGKSSAEAIAQARKMMNQAWYNKMVSFEERMMMGVEINLTAQGNDFKMTAQMENLLASLYRGGMGSGQPQKMEFNMPILDWVQGMTSQEGMIVLGPLPKMPEQNSDDRMRYVVLGYQNLNNNNVLISFGSEFDTPEKAAKSDMLSLFKRPDRQIFISETQLKAYQALPTAQLSKEEIGKWMEEASNRLKTDTVFLKKYQILPQSDFREKDMLGEMLKTMLLEKNYHPYKSLETISDVLMEDFYAEGLKEIEARIKEETAQNNMDELGRLQKQLEMFKKIKEISDLDKQIRKLKEEGKNEEVDKLQKKRDAFDQYLAISGKLERVENSTPVEETNYYLTELKERLKALPEQIKTEENEEQKQYLKDDLAQVKIDLKNAYTEQITYLKDDLENAKKVIAEIETQLKEYAKNPNATEVQTLQNKFNELKDSPEKMQKKLQTMEKEAKELE
jgi:hypothetical protein